jgi:hypothetical protein
MATTERETNEIGSDPEPGRSGERKAAPDTYRVRSPMDDDGRMRVSPLGRRAERTVVDYADPLVERKLSDLSEGAAVRLDLTPVPDDEGVVVSRVLPGTAGVLA